MAEAQRARPGASTREHDGSAQSTDLVDRAAAALGAGEPVVIHDDDLCVVALAAEAVDPAAIADLVRDARGVISVAMEAERVDGLELEELARSPGSRLPGYTVPVDAVVGTTTGISAADRAATIRALLAPAADRQICAPGHVMPVRAADRGILERLGITEAAVELARLAGRVPVVAMCEVLTDDGEALKPQDLVAHPSYSSLLAVSPLLVRARRRGLPVLSAANPATFREAMSMLASGAAAITVRDAEGAPRGMLATAITSYTDTPPSLLLSVAHSARTHAPLVEAVGIGVHLLGTGQRELAGVLAGKGDDKFADIEWEWDGDVPHVSGAVAYIRGARSACFEHYDHTIVVVDVETAEVGDDLPLVYFQRTFGWGLEHTDGR